MFYDSSYVAVHPVFTSKTKIIIAIILVAVILLASFWIFEATVKKQAYDFGHNTTNDVLYSDPDIALSKQAIRFARALTGGTDPVYNTCVAKFPEAFVTEHMSGLAQKLFGDEALEWVIDGIDDAFDEFLGERK